MIHPNEFSRRIHVASYQARLAEEHALRDVPLVHPVQHDPWTWPVLIGVAAIVIYFVWEFIR